jgi:hypothetical protein
MTLRQRPEGAFVALGGARHEVMIGRPVHPRIVNPARRLVAARTACSLWETRALIPN